MRLPLTPTLAAVLGGLALAAPAADARPTCGSGEDGPCPSGEKVEFVGKFNGGGAPRVQIHASPDASSKVIRTVKSGRRALIVCQTAGGPDSGPYGSGRLWDKLLHGGYVSDTKVYTGRDGRVAPDCGIDAPPPPLGNDPFVYDDPGAWRGEEGCSGGFTKGAAALSTWIHRRYRNSSNIGGYDCRPNTADTSQNSLHAEGRALDWMISAGSAANRKIVGRFIGRVSAGNWRLGRAMGIQEIIWNRRIWTSGRHTEGWRAYTGPNPHTDHVHIGMNRAGASKRTSFWTR